MHAGISQALTRSSGDLEDAGVKKQYERGYDMILNFFHNHFHA